MITIYAIAATIAAILSLFAWSGAATRARQLAERADYWRDIAMIERRRDRPTCRNRRKIGRRRERRTATRAGRT